MNLGQVPEVSVNFASAFEWGVFYRRRRSVSAGVKVFRYSISAVIWLLSISSAICSAIPKHDWVVRLVESDAVRSPDEPLHLRLPDKMPQAVRAALIYELDGVDITDGMTVTEDAVVFLPPEPLSPGRHQLLLIHKYSDGRRRELGIWDFKVVERPRMQAQAAGNQPLSFLTPIGETARLEVTLARPEASRSMTAGAAVQPNQTMSPYHRKPAVRPSEDFTALLNSGQFAVKMGKQKLAYKSLIHQDQERRGTVANWSLGDATRVLGFGMRTPAQHELSGIVMEHSWPTQNGDQFSLAGGLVHGDAPTVGGVRSGSAWSLAGDAWLLARRLRLRAEHAMSSANDAAADSPDDGGLAHKLAMELRSREKAEQGWLVGVEQSRVMPLFFSHAYPSLATDRLSLRTYGNLNSDVWRFDWSVERWRNNLAQHEHIATLQTGRTHFAASWTPADVFGLDFLGKPSYKFAADYGSVRELAAPVILNHTIPDNRTVDLSLQTEFAHSGWLWGLRSKGGQLRRVADASATARSIALDLYGDFSAVKQFPVKPVLSWQRKYQHAAGVVSDKWLAKLTSSAIELRQDLQARVDMQFMRRMQTGSTVDANTMHLGGSMVWTLQRPNADRNGLTLSVSGFFRDGNALPTPTARADDYRFMLSLSTANPLGDW